MLSFILEKMSKYFNSFETKLKLIYYKKRKKTELGYNVNSFDRFGDDLCELIISYLTIKEKIVFESVSKQWQRLVGNKHKAVIIHKSQNVSHIKPLFTMDWV